MANPQYYSIFTTQGLALLREAIQTGAKLGITAMSFGDGNGVSPEPNPDYNKLVKEVYRTQINRLAPSPNNSNWLEADAVIPSAVGGFNIREVGLWAGNILVAYANYPPTYKPSSDQGTAQIKTIRIVLQIDNTANFELKIDASIVMATIQAVEDAKAAIREYADQNKTQKFITISELLQSDINASTAIVMSYNAPIYGTLNPFIGGGELYADSEDTTSVHNGVNIFVAQNGTRWKRKKEGAILASQAGCKEGDFDNTDIINKAIQVVSEYKLGELVLDGKYKIGKLEKGITTTPFGDEPIYWLLKAKSNVTIRGRTRNDCLVLASGLVASNANEAQTKGYCVFGDYNQADIENFTVKTFTIDNNGYNNLLPVRNSFGSQALCPNIWFQRGKNIQVLDIHFLNNPGHQTVVLDSGVQGTKVIGNLFTDNGAGLLGNNNIWDHSTVYVRAKDFEISGNDFVITDGRLPEINTALEIHGIDGNVYANKTYGYPCPLIRAAFFGQKSKNVKVHDNIFNDCSQGPEFDAAAGCELYVDIYSNTITLRGQKPFDNRQNVGFGHSEYSFAAVNTTTNNYTEVSLRDNTVVQKSKSADWTTYNHSDNATHRGGKYNKYESKGNTFVNFSSGIHIDYRNNYCSYYFDDKYIDCGHIFEAERSHINCLIWNQNIQEHYTAGQVKEVILKGELVNCLYKAINLYIGTPPQDAMYSPYSNRWIIPYLGDEPESANTAGYQYGVLSIDSAVPLNSMSPKTYGKIKVDDGSYFFKRYGNTKKWNMYRRLTEVYHPRFFGDENGDIIDHLDPATHGYMGLVCSVSSVTPEVAGTWKNFGALV